MSKRHQYIASGKKTRKGQAQKERHKTGQYLKSFSTTNLLSNQETGDGCQKQPKEKSQKSKLSLEEKKTKSVVKKEKIRAKLEKKLREKSELTREMLDAGLIKINI